jgi:hypothetical protein
VFHPQISGTNYFCSKKLPEKKIDRKSFIKFWIFSNGCLRLPEQTATRRTGRFFAGVLPQKIR